jgi:hypothetical protein
MGRIFQKVVLIKTIFFPSRPILASKSTNKIGQQPWRPRIHPLLVQKWTSALETSWIYSSMYFLQGNMFGAMFGQDWASLFHVATTHWVVDGWKLAEMSSFNNGSA